MIDLVAELLALSDALERSGVRFAICGGLAVAIHGHVRATKDIDLLVHDADLQSALTTVAGLGFVLRAQPMTFGAGTEAERHVQRVSKRVDKELVTVDLICAEPAFVRVLDERERFERDGREISVVSRAGLIFMKRLAGRAQDLADIEALDQVTDE